MEILSKWESLVLRRLEERRRLTVTCRDRNGTSEGAGKSNPIQVAGATSTWFLSQLNRESTVQRYRWDY